VTAGAGRTDPSAAAYEAAIQRLCARVRQALEGGGTAARWVTPKAQELKRLRQQLWQLSQALHDGQAWHEMEAAFEALDGPGSFGEAASTVADLARAADAASKSLPKPQSKPVLQWLPQAFLHVWSYYHGQARITKYNDGELAEEYERVLGLCGLPDSRSTVREHLGAAIDAFDRFMPPPGVEDIL
jgi:hypothetical protein